MQLVLQRVLPTLVRVLLIRCNTLSLDHLVLPIDVA